MIGPFFNHELKLKSLMLVKSIVDYYNHILSIARVIHASLSDMSLAINAGIAIFNEWNIHVITSPSYV